MSYSNSFEAPHDQESFPPPKRLLPTEDRPTDHLSEHSKKNLTDRFHASTRQVATTDGSFVVQDLLPEGMETGLPVLFVPGYYAEGDSFLQPMLDVHLLGRRVVTYNAYHGIDDASFRARHAQQIAHLQQLDPETDIGPHLRKAQALIATLEAAGIPRADVVAHSEGAIVATIAAYLRPDLFARKAFLNPAGLIGEPMGGGLPGIFLGKALDDAGMAIRRNDRSLGQIMHDTLAACASMLPAWLVDPQSKRPAAFPYRVVSPRYDGNMKREYDAGDPKHLKAELNTLATRRLERWLALIDPETVAIGASAQDQLYPPPLVFKHARKGGVRELYSLQFATHNVQHFIPAQVTQFIAHALRLSDTNQPSTAS